MQRVNSLRGDLHCRGEKLHVSSFLSCPKGRIHHDSIHNLAYQQENMDSFNTRYLSFICLKKLKLKKEVSPFNSNFVMSHWTKSISTCRTNRLQQTILLQPKRRLIHMKKSIPQVHLHLVMLFQEIEDLYRIQSHSCLKQYTEWI